MEYLIPNANPKSDPRPVDAHEALIWLQQCVKDHDSDSIRRFQKINDHFTLVDMKTSLSEFWCYINLEKNNSKFPITACLLLHLAAYVGDIQTFEAITELYKSVYSSFNAIDIFKKIGTSNGNNILHLAILNGRDKNHEIVKALLKNMPALANDENHDTELPLELAFRTGKTELLRELFDATSVQKELEMKETIAKMQQEALDLNNKIQGLLKRFRALIGKQVYTFARKDGYYQLEPKNMLEVGVKKSIHLLESFANNINRNKNDIENAMAEVSSLLPMYESELSDRVQAIKYADYIATIIQDLRDFLNLPTHCDISTIKKTLLDLGYEGRLEAFDSSVFDKRVANYDELKTFVLFVNNIYYLTSSVAKKANTTAHHSNLKAIFEILNKYALISSTENYDQIFKLPPDVDNPFIGEYKSLKDMKASMDKWGKYYSDIRDLNAYFKKINRSDRILKDVLVILNKQEDQDKISRSIHESKQVKANYDWLASTHAPLFQLLMAFYQSGDNGEESVEEPPYFAFFKELVKDLTTISDKKNAEFFIREAKTVFYKNAKGIGEFAHRRMTEYVEEQIKKIGKNTQQNEKKAIDKEDFNFTGQKTIMTRMVEEYSLLLKKMKLLAELANTYNQQNTLYDEVKLLERTLKKLEKEIKNSKVIKNLEDLSAAHEEFIAKLKQTYEKLCNVFDLKLKWLEDRLTKIASLVEEYIAEPIDMKQHWAYQILVEQKENFISEIQSSDYKTFERVALSLTEKIDSKYTEACNVEKEYIGIVDDIKNISGQIVTAIKNINTLYSEIQSIIKQPNVDQQFLTAIEPIMNDIHREVQNLLDRKIFQITDTPTKTKSDFVIPKIKAIKIRDFISLPSRYEDTNDTLSDFAGKLKDKLKKIKKIKVKVSEEARKEEEGAIKSAKECYKPSLIKLIDLLWLISYLNPKAQEEFQEKTGNIFKVTGQAELNTPVKVSDLLMKLDTLEKANEFGKVLELAIVDATEIWQSIVNKMVAEKVNAYRSKFLALVKSLKDPITLNDKYKNGNKFANLFADSIYLVDRVDRATRSKAGELTKYSKKEFMSQWRDFEKLYLAAMNDMEKQAQEITEQVAAYDQAESEIKEIANNLIENQMTFVTVRDPDKTDLQDKYLSILADLLELLNIPDGQKIEINISKLHTEFSKNGINGLKKIVTKANQHLRKLSEINEELLNSKKNKIEIEQKKYIELVKNLAALKSLLSPWRDKKHLEINIARLDALLEQIDEGLQAQHDPKTDFLTYLVSRNFVLSHLEKNVASFINEIEHIELTYKTRAKEVELLLNHLDAAWEQYQFDKIHASADLVQKCSNMELAMERLNSISDVKEKFIPSRKTLADLNKYANQIIEVKALLNEVLLDLTKNKAIAQQAEEDALKREEVVLRQSAHQLQEIVKSLLALNLDITRLQANIPKIFNTHNIHDFVSFNTDTLIDRYFTLKRSAAHVRYINQTLNNYTNQQVKPEFKQAIDKVVDQLVRVYQDAIDKLATLNQNELAKNLIENCHKRDNAFILALTKLGVFGESTKMRKAFEPITSKLFLIDDFIKMPAKKLTATISKLQSLFEEHSNYIISQVSAFAEDESKTIEEKESVYAALLKTINGFNADFRAWQNKRFIGFNDQTILDYLQRIEHLNQAKNINNTPHLSFVNAQISMARILKSDVLEYLASLHELEEQYHKRISKIKKQIIDLSKHIQTYNELKGYATAQEFEIIASINDLIQNLQNNLGQELNVPNNLHAVKLTETEEDITSLSKKFAELLPTLINHKSKIESTEKAQRRELAHKLEISLVQLQDDIKKLLLSHNVDMNLLVGIPAILKPVNSLAEVINLKIDKIIKEQLTIESLKAAIQEVSAYSQDTIKPAILKVFTDKLDQLAKEYKIASDQYDAIKLNDDTNIKNTLQQCEKLDKQFSENIYKLGFGAEIIKDRTGFSALTTDLFLSKQVIELSASDFTNKLKELTKLVETHKNQVLSTIDAYKSAEIKIKNIAKVNYEEALTKLKNKQSRFQQILNLLDSPDLTFNNALLAKITEIETTIENNILQHNNATLLIQEEIANLEKNLTQALTNLLNATLEPYHVAVNKLTPAERTKSDVSIEVKNLYQLLLLKAPSHLTQINVQINAIANATESQFTDFTSSFKDSVTKAVTSVYIEKDRLLQLAEFEKNKQLEDEREAIEKQLIEEQQKKRDKEEQERLRKEQEEKTRKEKAEKERLKKEQEEKSRKEKAEKEQLKKEQEEKARKEKEKSEFLKEEKNIKVENSNGSPVSSNIVDTIFAQPSPKQESKPTKTILKSRQTIKSQHDDAQQQQPSQKKVVFQAPDQTSTLVANEKVSTAKIKQGLEALFSAKEKPLGDHLKPEAAKKTTQEPSQSQVEKNPTPKKHEIKMDVEDEGIYFKDLAERQKKAVLYMDNIIRQIRAQKEFNSNSSWLLGQLVASLATNEANTLRSMIVPIDADVDRLFNNTMESFANALRAYKDASKEESFSFIRFFKALFGKKIPIEGELITITHSKTYNFICDMETTYCSTQQKPSQAIQSLNLTEAFISQELRNTRFYYDEPSYGVPKRKADQKQLRHNQQVRGSNPNAYMPPDKVLTDQQNAALRLHGLATNIGRKSDPWQTPVNPKNKILKI